MKYIVVTGGVISGIGKGITASSIGLLLKQCGYSVTAIKIDPYLNLDAGTMSPYEHGECYVLSDGGETDLDLGNYERFLGIRLTRDHNLTTGKVYQRVLADERRGAYLGKTVQVVPHVTTTIKDWICETAEIQVSPKSTNDICLVELGGTIGDIESMPFVEALRQLAFEKPSEVCFVHVSLLPLLQSGELKTKPTQHSLKELMGLGISPDFLCLRAGKPVSESLLDKLSVSCQIHKQNIIINENISHIYQVPLLFEKQGFHEKLLAKLQLLSPICDLKDWTILSSHFEKPATQKIAIVGKYTGLSDSYLSLIRSLEYASFRENIGIVIQFVDSEDIDWGSVKEADGLVIAGGFGNRGVEGKIQCCEYARKHHIPLLGICLGLQMIAIEFARNVLGLANANSTEFDEECVPIVTDMSPYCQEVKGGTMRLGLQNIQVDNSRFYEGSVTERHRHRYELNPQYYEEFEKNGLNITGKSFTEGKSGNAEIIELEDHPFYVGCQFHPEYTFPNPIFEKFLKKTNQCF